MINPVLRGVLRLLSYSAALVLFLFLWFVAYLLYIPYSNTLETETKAKNGDAAAQRDLAFGYETGAFASYSFGRIRKDREKAIYWYSKSAASGNGEAAFYLARLYERESTLSTDRDLAKEVLRLYRFSASHGSRNGADRLAAIYETGLPGQPANKKLASYWKSQSNKLRSE